MGLRTSRTARWRRLGRWRTSRPSRSRPSRRSRLKARQRPRRAPAGLSEGLRRPPAQVLDLRHAAEDFAEQCRGHSTHADRLTVPTEFFFYIGTRLARILCTHHFFGMLFHTVIPKTAAIEVQKHCTISVYDCSVFFDIAAWEDSTVPL